MFFYSMKMNKNIYAIGQWQKSEQKASGTVSSMTAYVAFVLKDCIFGLSSKSMIYI